MVGPGSHHVHGRYGLGLPTGRAGYGRWGLGLRQVGLDMAVRAYMAGITGRAWVSTHVGLPHQVWIEG